MGINAEIEDAGKILGGRRRLDEPRTSGGPDDFIYRRWPRPNFADAARKQKTTPERSALFMAIYHNLSPRPAAVGLGQAVTDLWPELWRTSVDLVKLMWEEGLCHSIDRVKAVHDEAIRRKFVGTGMEEFACYATGRLVKKSVCHGLDLSTFNRLRAQWLPILGWPHDRRLLDDDAFGILQAKKGKDRWYQPVRAQGARIDALGTGELHETEQRALSELTGIVEAMLVERERDQALGAGRKVLGRAGVRIGPENPRRGARAATVQDMTDILGMRGVEFGSFLGQRERQDVLDQTFDAFYDLCTVLKLPAAGASLWGRAGLAFGSRGMGAHVAGHFEPKHWVVHMDRSQGAGVLAHEMGHAIDAAFAETAGLSRAVLLTEAVMGGWREHLLARLMTDVIAVCRIGPDGQETTFLKDARDLDRGKKAYWAHPAEMFARLFEAWVHDALTIRGRRNDFLVFPSSGADTVAGQEWRAVTSPYPKGRERKRMVDLMDEFIKVAMPLTKKALERPSGIGLKRE